MISDAVFSTCRTYRYVLTRQWDPDLPAVLYIGLNPSQADERDNDPTIRRCIGFAKEWGFGRMAIVNLFAYCTPYPSVLKKAKDPIGPKNDQYIREYAASAEKVVLIWGNEGALDDRHQRVLDLLNNPQCLRINKTGHPAHLLYLPKGTPLQPFLLKKQ
jgi:hypothetical protein